MYSTTSPHAPKSDYIGVSDWYDKTTHLQISKIGLMSQGVSEAIVTNNDKGCFMEKVSVYIYAALGFKQTPSKIPTSAESCWELQDA